MIRALASLDAASWSAFLAGSFSLITPLVGLAAALVWGFSLHRRLVRENHRLCARLAEAEAKTAAAENANLLKSDFLASIGHEMRTPISGILSFAEMAMTTDLTQLQREYLDRVLASAEWLTHVLSDVLDFSRIEASQLELESKEFSVETCILSAIKMVEAAAGRKHLEITCKIDPAIPALLKGDRMRLRQIIVNLLDNAIRFTTAGSIVLSAGLFDQEHDAATLWIAVADTGIGIPPDRQKSIFEPFHCSRTNPGPAGGTGLGLSLCRRLVELMGGVIEVQSHMGAGSTFRFTVNLQRAVPPVKVCDDMEILSKLTAHRLSVLIVEENALQRRFVTKLLESEGHQVSPASNATQAADLFCTDLFDLVLLSACIADTDAITLANSMRDLEGETTRTCIYVLRGQSDPISIPEYVNAGLDGCIPMPPSVENLLAVVNQVVATREVLQSAQAAPGRVCCAR